MPVEVVGAVQLREALKRYAPDLSKELQKEIGGYLKPVVNKARNYVPDQAPLSGWGLGKTEAYLVGYRPFPKFYAPRMKRGIGYTTTPSRPNKSGFTYLARIYNQSAAGAVYETAGRLKVSNRKSKSLNPNARQQFIRALPVLTKGYSSPKASGKPSYKMDGRLIFRAWAETNNQVTPKVLAAMVSAKNKFEAFKASRAA